MQEKRWEVELRGRPDAYSPTPPLPPEPNLCFAQPNCCWHNHIYNLNAPMQEKRWAGVTVEIDRQQAAIWLREAAVW